LTFLGGTAESNQDLIYYYKSIMTLLENARAPHLKILEIQLLLRKICLYKKNRKAIFDWSRE